jgi:hypothetical protein
VPKAKKEPVVLRDKNGTEVKIGDEVLYMRRRCTITKYDPNFNAIVEIDDPYSDQRHIGAKAYERWVRLDEIVLSKSQAVLPKPKPKAAPLDSQGMTPIDEIIKHE